MPARNAWVLKIKGEQVMSKRIIIVFEMPKPRG